MKNQSFENKDLIPLVNKFRSGNYNERYEALMALSEYPFDTIRDILFEALKDKHHRIRTATAKIIGKMGDETVVPQILHLLYEDSWIIRNSAQEALAQLPNHIAIPAFKGILASTTSDPQLRKNIAAVLARYDSPEATEILIHLFKTAQEDDLKATVVEYIGKKNDDAAIKLLFEALEDESWNVRNAASKSLKNFDVNTILNRAVNALSSPNRFVQIAVVELLIRSGNDDVIDALVKVLSEGNAVARLNALDVLNGINNDESKMLIVSALSDPHGGVRKKAIEILSSSPSKAVFNLLKRCIKSNNWNLKSGAIKVLGHIASDEALDILEPLLEDENIAVKLLVLEVLAQIGNRRCIRLIAKYISIEQMGSDAIRIIKSLDQDNAIKHLIALLTEDRIRNSIINALKGFDRNLVIRYLIGKATTGTPSHQIAAIQALGELGELGASKFLEEMKKNVFNNAVKSAIDDALKMISSRL